MRTSGRRGRERYAEVAKGNRFQWKSFASSAYPLRPLRPAVRTASGTPDALVKATRQAGDLAGEFQLQQACLQLRCRNAGAGDQGVQAHGVEAQGGQQRVFAFGRLRRCAGGTGSVRRKSSSTSCALSTSLAPWRSSAWQPRAWGEWIEPGMANTSRPCSAASRAVISEPDCSAASTTVCARWNAMRRRVRWCSRTTCSS